MRGVVMCGAGNVGVEEREDPKIIEPTDAIVRLSGTCVCRSEEVNQTLTAEAPRPQRHAEKTPSRIDCTQVSTLGDDHR